MQAAFKEFNDIRVKYKGEDVTKQVIHQIVRYKYLPNGKDLTYFDRYTGVEVDEVTLKYAVSWTILYKMDSEIMDEYLKEIEPTEAEYVRAYYLQLIETDLKRADIITT